MNELIETLAALSVVLTAGFGVACTVEMLFEHGECPECGAPGSGLCEDCERELGGEGVYWLPPVKHVESNIFGVKDKD